MSEGERIMATATVAHLADLEIGKPGEDRITSHLVTDEQRQAFARNLGTHVETVTNSQTIVCMDDRPDAAFADGTDDQVELIKRVDFQWPGGLVLGMTKAAVAADAAYLRDAKTLEEAYELTNGVLTKMGFEDGAHEGCGASKLVKASVETPVAREIALPTIGALMEINASREGLFDRNATHKQKLLERGFYDTWTPEWHKEFVVARAPQNYAYLRTEPDAVHGHKADGVVVVTGDNLGFAKNAFFAETGQMSFGVTPNQVMQIADKLGGTEEEREAIKVALVTDLLDVSDKLIAPGMPVFAQAA